MDFPNPQGPNLNKLESPLDQKAFMKYLSFSYRRGKTKSQVRSQHQLMSGAKSCNLSISV